MVRGSLDRADNSLRGGYLLGSVFVISLARGGRGNSSKTGVLGDVRVGGVVVVVLGCYSRRLECREKRRRKRKENSFSFSF